MHHEKNNTPAVILFFLRFFDTLEKDEVDFAKKTIFLMDCAPIQRSELFLRWASNRPERFGYLSKYSWSLAPVENIFAQIKAKRFPIDDKDLR